MYHISQLVSYSWFGFRIDSFEFDFHQMMADVLEETFQLERSEGAFSPLPFHFVEISTLLLHQYAHLFHAQHSFCLLFLIVAQNFNRAHLTKCTPFPCSFNDCSNGKSPLFHSPVLVTRSPSRSAFSRRSRRFVVCVSPRSQWVSNKCRKTKSSRSAII